MYEQYSHAILNEILNELKPEIREQELHHFYTRLGANFYSLFLIFQQLYGKRPDFRDQLLRLVETMARQYIERSEKLKKTDLERERDFNWFLHQKWVGMTLYADGFANDLKGLQSRLDYFEELGINLVHIMPILKCPQENNDGGYAVSDFRNLNEHIGSLDDLSDLAFEMRARGILLVLDVVVNHVSNEHRWAQQAQANNKNFQDYFYIFKDREIPDM
ncbi:alpha-amylase, partial [bacterium]|nr:alpha-amylase [bacterium]